MFNNPELNFRDNYELFDKGIKQQIYVGGGEKARRASQADQKLIEVDCPGPELCELGQKAG